jgi:hypothetical protein
MIVYRLEGNKRRLEEAQPSRNAVVKRCSVFLTTAKRLPSVRENPS